MTNWTDQAIDRALGAFYGKQPLPEGWQRRAMRAALEAAGSPEPEWRPIDSAPRDGSEVWLFSPFHKQVVGWWECVEGGDHPENGPSIYWWVSDHVEFIDGPHDAPTHWRPLPAPPEPKPRSKPEPSRPLDVQLGRIEESVATTPRLNRGLSGPLRRNVTPEPKP